jgi:hypothetical protein
MRTIMARTSYSYVIAAALCAGALAGCATQTPALDEQFGSAVRQSIAQQTLYPDAAARHETVNGIDGAAGTAIVERYREGFRGEAKPAPAPVPLGF